MVADASGLETALTDAGKKSGSLLHKVIVSKMYSVTLGAK